MGILRWLLGFKLIRRLLLVVVVVAAIGYFGGPGGSADSPAAPAGSAPVAGGPAAGSAGGGSGQYFAPVAMPPGVVKSGFGPRKSLGPGFPAQFHYGLDIAAPLGTPIVAVAAGTVIKSGPASGFGQWMQVQHADGMVTVYGHMSRRDFGVGAQVAAGQEIALVGQEGQATGPHVHLEVWPNAAGVRSQRLDPRPWLASHGVIL